MVALIYFVILATFPIIVSLLVHSIVNKNKPAKLKREIKYIIRDILTKIIKVVIMIGFINLVLLKTSSDDINIEEFFLNILYFIILFSWIIFVNYFSTRYLKFKICMKIFLDELVKFIGENFILNLSFFTLLVFVKSNNDLTIGLVGSYFFFALTTIHSGYKQNIRENNKNLKFLYKFMQVLLNIILLISFIGIEQMIYQYSNNLLVTIKTKYTISALIFGILIGINSFLPKIELFCKQLDIFKKKENMIKYLYVEVLKCLKKN